MAEGGKWRPTERQRRALEYAREALWDYSVTELAAAVGVHRRTYYKWFERAEFRAWWQGEWQRFFALKMARLWGKIFAAACGEKNNSSAAHAKLMIERFDKGLARNGTANGKDAPPLKTYINVDIPRVTGKADERDGNDNGA